MDFFAAQEQSRRRSRRLLWLVLLAAVLIVGAVTAVLALLLAAAADTLEWLLSAPSSWAAAHRDVLWTFAVAAFALIGFASLYRISRLAGGGGEVARALGGTEVAPDANDPLRRRLRNVTEEMAIASGVPVPEIYVLESEPGINAFAAGSNPSNAAIAVTRGALEQLDRDELQGVVAHEFSHILNGDMRLNIRLMGLLFGILLVGLMGRLLLHSSRMGMLRAGRSRRDGGNGIVAVVLLAGLLLIVIGGIGVFFGRLIRAGISRQREYLADASAVQFTRSPQGIAGALKKIAGFAPGSDFRAADSEEVSHMLFARGGRMFSGVFATHPPLEQRIAALDPSFDAARSSGARRAGGRPAEGVASAVAGAEGPAHAARGFAAGIAAGAGQVAERHVIHARALHRSLTPDLDRAVHSREEAPLVLLALLLHPSTRVRERQLDILRRSLGEAPGGRVEALAGHVRAAGVGLRLPLLELAFPALKERPARQLEECLALAQRLSEASGELELFEFCLLRLVRHYLDDAGVLPAPAAHRRGPRRVRRAMTDLYRILAIKGAPPGDEGAARAAFEAGRQAYAHRLGGRGEQALDDFAMVTPWQARLDAALAAATELPPGKRRAAIEGLAAVAAYDRKLTLAESELLRLMCAILDVPLPPLLTPAETRADEVA